MSGHKPWKEIKRKSDLRVHVQPDKDEREKLALDELDATIQDDIDRRTNTYKTGDMYGFKIGVDLEERPIDKLVRERMDKHITEKAQVRQTECWSDGCVNAPYLWVREVRFDLGKDSPPMHKASVGTESYNGPVPGFCRTCLLKDAPSLLASKVYFNHPVMEWGFRPSRFFVLFTDGTIQGGECIWINPNPQVMPNVKTEYIPPHKEYDGGA